MRPSKEFVKEWCERPENAHVLGSAVHVFHEAHKRWKRWSILFFALIICQTAALFYSMHLESIPDSTPQQLSIPWFVCAVLAFIPCMRYKRHRRVANVVLVGMENAMVTEYRNALGGTGVR